MKKSHNQRAKELIQGEHRFIKHCVRCGREMSATEFLIHPFCEVCIKEQKDILEPAFGKEEE